MELLILLFFVLLFFVFYFKSHRDFSYSITLIGICLQFFPPYLSILGVRYFTIINMVSLLLNIKYIINNKLYSYEKKYLSLLLYYLILLQIWSILNDTFLQNIQLGAFRTCVGYFSICSLCFLYIKTKDHLIILNKTIRLILLSICIYGFFCYTTSSNPILLFLNLFYGSSNAILDSFSIESRGGLSGRIQGLTVHPLEYGGIMLCFFFYILNTLHDKTYNKVYNYLLLCFISANIFLTGSRSAIISLILGIMIYIYINNQIRFKTKIKFTICFLSCYFITATYFSFFKTYSDFINSIIFFWEDNNSVKGSNFDMRLTQLDAAFGLISKDTISYLFGLGDGWVRNYSLTHKSMHPVLMGFESILFIGLIEYGVVGFIILTCGLFFIFFKLSRKFHTPNSVPIMIISFFIFQLFTGDYGKLTFLILISLLLKINIIKQKEKRPIKNIP